MLVTKTSFGVFKKSYRHQYFLKIECVKFNVDPGMWTHPSSSLFIYLFSPMINFFQNMLLLLVYQVFSCSFPNKLLYCDYIWEVASSREKLPAKILLLFIEEDVSSFQRNIYVERRSYQLSCYDLKCGQRRFTTLKASYVVIKTTILIQQRLRF